MASPQLPTAGALAQLPTNLHRTPGTRPTVQKQALTLASAVGRIKEELALELPAASARDAVVAAWAELNWAAGADTPRASATLREQVEELCTELGVETGWALGPPRAREMAVEGRCTAGALPHTPPAQQLQPSPGRMGNAGPVAVADHDDSPKLTPGTRARRRAAFLGGGVALGSAEKFLAVRGAPSGAAAATAATAAAAAAAAATAAAAAATAASAETPIPSLAGQTAGKDSSSGQLRLGGPTDDKHECVPDRAEGGCGESDPEAGAVKGAATTAEELPIEAGHSKQELRHRRTVSLHCGGSPSIAAEVAGSTAGAVADDDAQGVGGLRTHMTLMQQLMLLGIDEGGRLPSNGLLDGSLSQALRAAMLTELCLCGCLRAGTAAGGGGGARREVGPGADGLGTVAAHAHGWGGGGGGGGGVELPLIISARHAMGAREALLEEALDLLRRLGSPPRPGTRAWAAAQRQQQQQQRVVRADGGEKVSDGGRLVEEWMEELLSVSAAAGCYQSAWQMFWL
jgi:hypothetical protein